MVLLPSVFIKFIPNMLNAGNKTGAVKNAFSDTLKLRFGNQFFRPRDPTSSRLDVLIKLFPKVLIANTMNAILNEINNGMVAKGLS